MKSYNSVPEFNLYQNAISVPCYSFSTAVAVDEKADMERTSRGAAAYKVIEEIRDYSQLGGGLKKELERLQQQIFFQT